MLQDSAPPPQQQTTFGNGAFGLIQDFLRKNDNLHLQLEEARKKESEHEKNLIREVSKYEKALVTEVSKYEKALIREAYKYEKLQNELVKAYDDLRKTQSKFSIRSALAITTHKLGGLGISDHDLTPEKGSATVTKGPMPSKIISTPNDTISSPPKVDH